MVQVKAKTKPGAKNGVSLAAVEKTIGMSIDRARNLFNRLTPRQLDVARLMARGLPNRRIADQLGISPKTLDIHRADVFDKCETATSAGVARIIYLVSLADAVLDH
jgi:FixJ family two-component response regulator